MRPLETWLQCSQDIAISNVPVNFWIALRCLCVLPHGHNSIQPVWSTKAYL